VTFLIREEVERKIDICATADVANYLNTFGGNLW